MPVVSGRAGPRGPRLGLASSISSSCWILSRDTTSLRRLLHGGFLPLFRSVQSNSKHDSRKPRSIIVHPTPRRKPTGAWNRQRRAVPAVGRFRGLVYTRGGSNRYGRGRPRALRLHFDRVGGGGGSGAGGRAPRAPRRAANVPRDGGRRAGTGTALPFRVGGRCGVPRVACVEAASARRGTVERGKLRHPVPRPGPGCVGGAAVTANAVRAVARVRGPRARRGSL